MIQFPTRFSAVGKINSKQDTKIKSFLCLAFQSEMELEVDDFSVDLVPQYGNAGETATSVSKGEGKRRKQELRSRPFLEEEEEGEEEEGKRPILHKMDPENPNFSPMLKKKIIKAKRCWNDREKRNQLIAGLKKGLEEAREERDIATAATQEWKARYSSLEESSEARIAVLEGKVEQVNALYANLMHLVSGCSLILPPGKETRFFLSFWKSKTRGGCRRRVTGGRRRTCHRPLRR